MKQTHTNIICIPQLTLSHHSHCALNLMIDQSGAFFGGMQSF